MNKSNPVLFEWLKSPIIYYKESPPMEFEKLLTQIYDKDLLENINGLLQKKIWNRNGN